MKYQMSQIIPGIMGMPARLCSIFLFEHFGRKWTMAGSLFQGTLMNLLILFIPSGTRPPPPSHAFCQILPPSCLLPSLSNKTPWESASYTHNPPSLQGPRYFQSRH